MNVTASEKFISTMVDRIVRGFQPSQVVLFGSHARGTATEWSDVDLLVILPNVSDKRNKAIEIRRALGDLPVCKDIVRKSLVAGTLWEPRCVQRSAKGRFFMDDPELL